MLNMEKTHRVDHLVVYDYIVKLMYGCLSILNMQLQKGEGLFIYVLNILIYINCSNKGRAI